MVPFLPFITIALAGMVVASVGNHLSLRELRMKGNLERRADMANLDCTDIPTSTFLYHSYVESFTLASIAFDYIQENGTSDPVFVAYFGAGQANSNFQTLVFTIGTSESSPVLSCTDPNSVCPNSNTAAYAGTEGSEIYFCPGFYNQANTTSLCSGTTIDSGNVRGGTLLSVISTSVSQIQSSSSGCSNARSLAESNPASAIANADNYSCFAMQVYVDTQCSQTTVSAAQPTVDAT